MKKFLSVISAILLLSLTASAKPVITVHGTVMSRDHKDLLVGALVKNLDNNTTTTSDVEGTFVISAEEGTQLEVTYVGYAPTKVKVKDSQITVYLSKTGGTRFALKPNFEYGVFNEINAMTSYMDYDKFEFSSYRAGVDFGYSFFHKNKLYLEANLGLAYYSLNNSLSANDLYYSYLAPPSADIDGESYERHYEISYISQKVSTSFLNIPLYLSYGAKYNSWFGMHVDLGLNFNIKLSSTLKDVSANLFSYGVYPQYDYLMIDAPYMNNFGYSNLDNGNYLSENPSVSGFNLSLMVGIGFEFYIYGPISIDISARLNQGLKNIYETKGTYFGYEEYAPITYSIYEGEQVRSLTNFVEDSKITQLSVRAGINFRF